MITFAIVRTADSYEIVNATSEKEAYESVVGEPYPEETPAGFPIDDDLEWSCIIPGIGPGPIPTTGETNGQIA